MPIQTESLARRLAFLRKNAGGMLIEFVVNFALPYLIFSLAQASLGDLKALIASSAPPILWSSITFARKREVDFISAFVLAGIALSLLAMLGGGSVKFLQLREKLVTMVIGLAFLGSAVIGKPLIYEFARAGMKRNQSAELADFEARRDDPGLRRSMTIMTVVWGAGLLADAALASAMVMVLTVKQYLLVGPIIGYGTVGALALWSVVYVRRRRLGESRRAEAAGARIDTPATLLSD